MKYEKINQIVLKEVIKENRVHYTVTDDSVIVGMPYTIGVPGFWVVPKCFWFIDMTVNKSGWKTDAFSKFLDVDLTTLEQLIDSGEVLMIPDRKKPVKVLRNKAGEKIYINSVYLENFGAPKGCNIKFYGTGPKSPIYIVEQGDIINGCVLPININREV